MKRVLWLCLALLCACAEEGSEATAIAISVKTDLSANELREVVYRMFPRNADPRIDQPLYEVTVPVEQLERPLVIVRGKAEGFLISIEGFVSRGTEAVISYQTRAAFEEGETLALRVFLGRACYRRNCGFGGLTCHGQNYGTVLAGTCGAIPMPELPRVRTPGEESDWTPMPVAPMLDAGISFGNPYSNPWSRDF